MPLECDYRCGDGTCVNKDWNIKCDFVRDCPDGSDEFDCSCEAPHHYKCKNGYCLEAWKRCDGNADCNDNSDELHCPSCTGKFQFKCKITGECIRKDKMCDRKIDCRDGSDENGCAYWRTRYFLLSCLKQCVPRPL